MKKRGIFSWISNLQLKVKLPLILFLPLLVVFLSTLFSARIPYAAYDAQISDRSVQVLTLIADQLQSEMERFGDVTFQMLGDNVLQKNLSVMYRTPVGSSAWVEAQREVRTRVQNFAYYDNTILAIQLMSADGTLFSEIRRGQPVSPNLIPEIYESAKEKGGREFWLPDPTGENTLICARNVREVSDLTLLPLGVIAVRVDFAKIVERCSAALRDMNLPLSLAIYADDMRIYASDDMKALTLADAEGYLDGTLHDRDSLYVPFTSGSTGWKFITALPYASITSAVTRATSLSLALSVIAMLVSMLLGYLLIASLLRHIQMLLQKYSDFSSGRFPLVAAADDPYHGRKDEIGQLHSQFGEMARAYNQMIEENYIKQQLLLEAQFHQLRVQVRPHFLFNVLESIYCLAKADGDTRIATMTEGLSKMLRSSLNDKRDIVTLGEDLDTARDYLAIQTLRYGDRLQVAFDVPEALSNVRIPNMTVQPLVENAVLHAAEEMMEGCRILISAQRTGAGVTVTVENNGATMDEDMLEKLESGAVKPQGIGIGLTNIHKRIQLAFSDAYGLQIKSGGGVTRVHVLLPAQEEEEAHE